MSINPRSIATLGVGFGALNMAFLGLWPDGGAGAPPRAGMLTNKAIGIVAAMLGPDGRLPASMVYGSVIGSGDKSLIAEIPVPASRWEITHSLNKIPSVIAINGDGTEVLCGVSFPDLSTVIIEFEAPMSGRASLN